MFGRDDLVDLSEHRSSHQWLLPFVLSGFVQRLLPRRADRFRCRIAWLSAIEKINGGTKCPTTYIYICLDLPFCNIFRSPWHTRCQHGYPNSSPRVGAPETFSYSRPFIRKMFKNSVFMWRAQLSGVLIIAAKCLGNECAVFSLYFVQPTGVYRSVCSARNSQCPAPDWRTPSR